MSSWRSCTRNGSGALLAVASALIAVASVGCFVPLPHRALLLIIPVGAIRAAAGPHSGSKDAESDDEDTAPESDGAENTATNEGTAPFNRRAARAAVVVALGRVRTRCRLPATSIEGAATLTYERTGVVTGVSIDLPSGDAAFQMCLSNALLAASIPPYDGDSVQVKKRFSFDPQSGAGGP